MRFQRLRSVCATRDPRLFAAVPFQNENHFILNVSFRRTAPAHGVPVQYVDVPPSDAEKALLAAGLPSWMADALITLFGIFAAGHASECTQAVRDIIGREPHGYRDFVRDHLAAFGAE